MNKIVMGAMALAAMSLGACDGSKGGDTKSPPAKTVAKVPAKKTSVNQPVEDAMMAIPPELRESYQAAFVCEVNRQKADKKAVNVTPAYVKDLTRRLRENPGIAKC